MGSVAASDRCSPFLSPGCRALVHADRTPEPQLGRSVARAWREQGGRKRSSGWGSGRDLPLLPVGALRVWHVWGRGHDSSSRTTYGAGRQPAALLVAGPASPCQGVAVLVCCTDLGFISHWPRR